MRASPGRIRVMLRIGRKWWTMNVARIVVLDRKGSMDGLTMAQVRMWRSLVNQK